MSIEKIIIGTQYIEIYNQAQICTAKLPVETGKTYQFTRDFAVFQPDPYLVNVFDENGKRACSLYSGRYRLVRAEKDAFFLQSDNGKEISFSYNGLSLGAGYNRHSTQYDVAFLAIGHFQKYPQMRPFVGKNYEKTKLLLVGESHYLPPNSSANLIANWYEGNSQSLSAEEYMWTHTAMIINNTDFKSKGHRIYANLEKVLSQVIGQTEDTGLVHCAYMNFFQRPAEESKGSIQVKDKDRAVGNDVLRQVCHILKPRMIYFVSRKAFGAYSQTEKLAPWMGQGAHPSCSWWNRKTSYYTKPPNQERITGKESLIYFIQEGLGKF